MRGLPIKPVIPALPALAADEDVEPAREAAPADCDAIVEDIVHDSRCGGEGDVRLSSGSPDINSSDERESWHFSFQCTTGCPKVIYIPCTL